MKLRAPLESIHDDSKTKKGDQDIQRQTCAYIEVYG
jgi:hypothetical protein